jgi:hypothetical protein
MEKKYVEVESRGLTLRGFLELPDVPGNGRVPLARDVPWLYG